MMLNHDQKMPLWGPGSCRLFVGFFGYFDGRQCQLAIFWVNVLLKLPKSWSDSIPKQTFFETKVGQKHPGNLKIPSWQKEKYGKMNQNPTCDPRLASF